MAQQISIAQVHIDAAKEWLKNSPSLNNDTPGTFLNDEKYFDSLPDAAKVFICAIQKAGLHPDMSKLCRSRASIALAEAKRNPTKENYDIAIAIYALMVHCATSEDPARAEYLSEFGHALQAKWEFSRDSEDFDNILDIYSKTVHVATPDHRALGAYVTDLAVFSSKKYDQTKENLDRVTAKNHFLWAMELSKNHPMASIMISNAGDFIRRTAKKKGPSRMEDLKEACRLQEEATKSLGSSSNLPAATIWRNAGMAYHDLFVVTREEVTSELAMNCFGEALTVSPPPSSMYDLAQNELAEHHMVRYRVWKQMAHLTQALSIYDEQINRNPEAYLPLVGKAECHRIMGSAAYRNELSGVYFDTASRAIALAIDKIPPEGDGKGWLLYRKSSIYYSWFESSGDLNHLLVACEEAKRSTEYDHDPSFWSFSRWYSEVLLLRHTYLRSATDIENAIVAVETAIDHLSDEDAENQADCYRTYGQCLVSKYALDNELETLFEAIAYLTAACMAGNEEDIPASRYLALNDLGNAYCKKFDHSHTVEDLNQAVEFYQSGFDVLSKTEATEEHPDWLMLSAGMGYVMFQRFLFWGVKDDITASIKHYEIAISRTNPGHAKYAPRASNLGFALQQKYIVDHDLKHLKQAQKLLRDALAYMDSENLPQKRNLNLQMGNVYMSLFLHAPEKRDENLDLAEECYSAAMNIESSADTKSSTEIALAVINLALLWRERASIDGKLEDFQKSLEYSDQACTLIQDPNPRLWTVRLQKATTLSLAHEKHPTLNYGQQALGIYKDLASTLHSTPAQIIQALEGAASLEMKIHNDAKVAFEYYDSVIKILPEAIMIHTSRLEQLRFIRKYHTIPSSATALSIQAGNDPKITVKVLESSRAFIWNRLLAEQDPITRLRESFPELADYFEKLRARLALSSPSSEADHTLSPDTLSPRDHHRLRRQTAAKEYSTLLRKIREKKDFENFLQPSDPLKDLQAVDRDSPIIFINFSQHRNDAVIIGLNKVYTVHLPAVKMNDLIHYASQMYKARILLNADTSEEFGSACSIYNGVMKWLWVTVALPILDQIDLTEFENLLDSSSKPKITWVSSGWLSLFPIHAAGDFGHDPTTTIKNTCVSSRIVSSYTPSLQVYSFLKSRCKMLKSSAQTHPSSPLLIGMKQTPSKSDLDIDSELSAVQKILGKSSTHPMKDLLINPSSHTLLPHLPNSTSMHLACHGIASTSDPSSSTLLLSDWRTSPLNIRAILKLTSHLQKCNFIFLSACESALNKDLRVRDEGIHIAGAWHMVGVPGVVATMWGVGNGIASEVAGEFYGGLRRGKREGVGGAGGKGDGDERVHWEGAAKALNEAVEGLRIKGVQPILWGAFVHSGA